MLVEHRARLDPQMLLVKLVRTGISDRDVFEFLIRRGADPRQTDANGDTPLTLAIAQGHLATLTRLIVLGADVNQADAQGRLPLMLALKQPGSRRGDARRIIELLQRNGARAGPEADHPPDATPANPTQRTPE